MRWYRLLRWFALLTAAAGAVADETVSELARIHVAAIGGAERVEDLKRLRAEGRTRIGGQELRFTLWAERPNRIRIEARAGGRILIRGWDGTQPPWKQNGREAAAELMTPDEAASFVADAEFDDPLYRWEERGFTLENARFAPSDAPPTTRLRLTGPSGYTAMLYLAGDTALIVRRDETRRTSGGQAETVEVYYDDFRPVRGVILPHRIRAQVGQRMLYETQLERIDPEPTIPAEFFSAPQSGADDRRG